MADSYKEMANYDKALVNYNRAYELTEQQDYKKAAQEMEEKINPGKKKGFFSKLFS
jgi:hypothetical protein